VSDWEAELSDDDREVWEEFVQSVRRDALEKIDQSSFVLQLVPKGEADIKFAVELGLAIMLDKPIVAVISPETEPPGKLLRVVDIVVRADIDTEEGRQQVAEALQTMREPFGEEMP
jgi:hypothetical protein